MTVCRPADFGSDDVGRYVEKFHRLSLQEPPQAVQSGHDTAVWRLRARSGRYIAKIYAARRLDAVREEISLLDHLAGCGIRTPALLESTRRQRIGLIGQGGPLRAFLARKCPIVVTLLEDGRRVHPQTVTRQELTLVARFIALMHEAMQVYPRLGNVRRLERWGAHLGRFEDLLGSPNARSFDSHALARWSDLDRRMEQAAGGAATSPLTESVLHGDFGLEHVRFATGKTLRPADIYVFDFSDFSYGPVVFDLAAMLSRFYWEDDIGLDRWEQLRAWLLEGYESEFALSENDRCALDGALMERLLIEIRYLNRLSRRRQSPYCPEGVQKRYELCAYLFERNADGVAGRTGSAA